MSLSLLAVLSWYMVVLTVPSIANATADLVMIAAWSSALQAINGEAIPVRVL